MHLHSNLTGIQYRGHIRCDDGCDACRLGCIQSTPHICEVLSEKSDVEGQICLYVMLGTDADNLRKVSDLEIIGRMRPHIEFLHSEIYRVGTALYGCVQAFEVTRRRHNFQSMLVGCFDV